MRWSSEQSRLAGTVLSLLGIVAGAGLLAAAAGPEGAEPAAAQQAQVLRGRQLVVQHGCGDCHGGFANPAADGWLAGARSADMEIPVGPFKTRPRNLTPDSATGIGRYTERQIFNALRYGLRPGETPDVTITSATPGEGNHPATPRYLAPSMPWAAFRHMSDQELRDIAAYLKRAVRPVSNRVQDSEGPPDFWASENTVAKIGPHPARPFPTAQESQPAAQAQAQVRRGRQLVINHACGDCHGGGNNPASAEWLSGYRPASPPGIQSFQVGPFKTYARNLTPDNVTGMGRFTERQIFNALRYGLRPGETPDVTITSTTPGQGNFPASPKYLAPPMPWPAWRHMSDQEIRDVAAYLKRGVKPVRNRVPDSEGPPDFWAGEYTEAKYGPYPAAAFPTANEVAQR